MYYAQVFWPVALIPLLEPLVLLIAVPQLFINTISGQSTTRNIHFYYTAIVTARPSRRRIRRARIRRTPRNHHRSAPCPHLRHDSRNVRETRQLFDGYERVR